MELAYRKGADAFVPAGSYRRLEANLRQHAEDLSEIPAVVLACFDASTRMLPFVMYDRMIFPAGARTVAGALRQSGFARTRAVFGLWNPRFRPSQARVDGRPIQILLVSGMALNSAPMYQAVRDAWSMGEDRPLIIVGGPKAIYEPYHFWEPGTPLGPAPAADAACTGEAYVLLDMLTVVLAHRRKGEHVRKSFERARLAGALNGVPGLVYLAPEADPRRPVLVDTGLQRLVQHLDEMPDEATGYGLLEPPSRKPGLAAAPLPDSRVRRHAPICSLLVTQGCKFSCSYCPIPAVNQKTWRFRSPENLARQMSEMRDRFGIKFFFGTDDNFLNRRDTAEAYFEALASWRTGKNKRLGGEVRWGTEATQHDTWKNRDLLPLASRAGLAAIWFGIEDLTAELVNKGQKPEVTTALFELLHRHKIMPMAMMMFHQGQPYHSRRSLSGIANQIDFLRQAGACTVQVLLHTPAVGSREYERAFAENKVLRRLGGEAILERGSEKYGNGNYVLMEGRTPMWLKQLQTLAVYFRFYNPLNLWRAARDDGSPLRWYRVGFQLAGMWGAVRTAFRSLPYLARLLGSSREYHQGPPRESAVPVRLVPGAFPRTPQALPVGRPKPRAVKQAA